MSETTSPPAEATTLEGQYAGFITRFSAFVIDILIAYVMVIISTAVVVLIFGFFEKAFRLLPWADGSGFESAGTWVAGGTAVITLLLMGWLYPILFWMINGQTIGKRIMGLRVVRMDGKEMTFGRSFVRVFGYLLSAAPLFLGFFWVLFSNKRQGWHDLLAGTCVLYSWEASASAALESRIKRVGQKIMNRDDDS